MNILFRVDFEGTNKSYLEIEEEPVTPSEFEQIIFTVKELVREFRHL